MTTETDINEAIEAAGVGPISPELLKQVLKILIDATGVDI